MRMVAVMEMVEPKRAYREIEERLDGAKELFPFSISNLLSRSSPFFPSSHHSLFSTSFCPLRVLLYLPLFFLSLCAPFFFLFHFSPSRHTNQSCECYQRTARDSTHTHPEDPAGRTRHTHTGAHTGAGAEWGCYRVQDWGQKQQQCPGDSVEP
jgi:hypothetical protein